MAETTHTGQRWDKLSWKVEFFTVFHSIRRPYITFKLPRGDMDMPPCPYNFFWYLAIEMCHFRRLWNGMCDRHRVEITVMQFTGHSLPVHHFVTARWDFFPISYCQPSCILHLNTFTFMLYSHEQLCIHICMQKHNDTMKTSGHSSLEKYNSHFIWKGCVWEGVGDWTELQHIDPHSYVHNIVSFPFSLAAQPGAGGPASLGHDPHSSIFSPTATAQLGALRAPSARC